MVYGIPLMPYTESKFSISLFGDVARAKLFKLQQVTIKHYLVSMV